MDEASWSVTLELSSKNNKDDRIIVLKPIDGKPLRNNGVMDTSLLTGGNKLHAVRHEQTSLWHVKYDSGILPQPLKQQWTGFDKMLKFLTDYYFKRNIEITEVIS